MRNRWAGVLPAGRVRCLLPVLAAAVLVSAAPPLYAQSAPPVSVGAGLQTSFVNTSPEEGDTTTAFKVNSARLYLSGPVTDKVTFMFNTEYNGSTSTIGVMDAVARIAVSPKVNIWMGRFLPPSDRANLYGPYYSNHWAVYSDGVQDGYPFAAVGRDDGVAYWGQFGILKVSGGLFDGSSSTGRHEVLMAARGQLDFWDKEDGYYLNGTYYGAKDLLAVGAAIQAQDGDDDTRTAGSLDFLMEKKLGNGGTVSVEAEYTNYDQLGGYDASYGHSEGGYILGAYLFPKPKTGMGAFQLLGKYAEANFSKGISIAHPDYDQKTTELNLNYIIKEFNARVMFFFKNTDFSAVKTSDKQFGIGLQIQM